MHNRNNGIQGNPERNRINRLVMGKIDLFLYRGVIPKRKNRL
jgi:hypothetical protein